LVDIETSLITSFGWIDMARTSSLSALSIFLILFSVSWYLCLVYVSHSGCTLLQRQNQLRCTTETFFWWLLIQTMKSCSLDRHL